MRNDSKKIPFLKPRPPALSAASEELASIERSGIYTNFGPKNAYFERTLTEYAFGGRGSCVTTCNATIGLMLAIRAQLPNRGATRSLALMPSYTFAATAHAAIWAGLRPLLCDVAQHSWLPYAISEENLLRKFGGDVAVIVPYATFGACLDLDRYTSLARRYDIPVVVDAAASLGTLDKDGVGFGSGFRHPVVYSLHATKSFATAEAGVVYCADPAIAERIRTMSNFGFGEPRNATMAGLNGKLSEVGALLACLRLKDFDQIIVHRERLYSRYKEQLPDLTFQAPTCGRQAHQFTPVLIPEFMADRQETIMAALSAAGIGAANYFRPHLAQHRYFQEMCEAGPLPNTERISSRSLSLPLSDTMTVDDVDYVCNALRDVVGGNC